MRLPIACALALAAPVAEADGLDLPAPRQSVETDAATISYYEVGDPEGATVLFVHGLPFSAYSWRNVLPAMDQDRRLIAVDLVGFGDSTGSGYGVLEQARHLADFVDALNLEGVTLMGHDWGAGIALIYAAKNPGDVAAFAFTEGAMPPVYPRPALDEITPETVANIFRALREPGLAETNVLADDIWQETIMPTMTLDPLPDAAVAEYKRPFPTPESRRPLLEMSLTLPIGGEPADVAAAYTDAVAWWTTTEIPKLVLYAEPGRLFPKRLAEWTQANAETVTIASIGTGAHALQEDAPGAVAEGLQAWLDGLSE
ncbi:MAG: haloalkane dehalogenase [Pseudomonadota bacterium]